MPPVMGAAAFIMAEFLQVPYGAVCIAATIPAILYYACLFIHVDLEAAKQGSAPRSRATCAAHRGAEVRLAFPGADRFLVRADVSGGVALTPKERPRRRYRDPDRVRR